MKFKSLFLFYILIILLASVVIARNCDYYAYKNYTEEETRFYLGNELLEGKLEIEDTLISGDKVNFKVFNPFNFEVEVKIDYVLKSNWFGNRAEGVSGIIPPKELKVLRGYYQDDPRTSLSDVKLTIIRPEELNKKLEKVTKQNKICKNCASDEIFCQVNNKCVKKKLVSLGAKPECNLYQECISQYINPETGLCEKSPAQIKEEKNQRLKEELERKDKERKFLIFSIIILVSVVIVGIIIIYVLKYKNEKEKQNTLQKEIELEAKKIQSKEFKLNDLKKQIAQIKKHRKLEKKEIEKLNNLKTKRDELIQDIKKQYSEITKPFPDSQANNRLVVINPYLGGYKCFYKEGLDLKDYPISSLLHRWVWKKQHRRNPKPGYHIHHIDGDKYNNDPKNLEEIEGEEHYEKHR